MKRQLVGTAVCSLGLLLAGCQVPTWMQWPTFRPSNPQMERQSYIQHDPLPDNSLGPNIGFRPRESVQQRAEPRRTLEASQATMMQEGQFVPQYQAPQSYPGVVNP